MSVTTLSSSGVPGPVPGQIYKTRPWVQGTRKLVGDGTWPFVAWADYGIAHGVSVVGGCSTWFGGDSDPMDDGQTASGLRTAGNPGLRGCALPMRGKGCPATEGSPVPPMPYRSTFVDIWCEETGIWIVDPVIDLGPNKNATTNPNLPHTIDLTQASFQALGLHLARGIVHVDYRVRGAALVLPPV